MIINNSRRFIFIHIPKTAGTTVSAILNRFTKVTDIEIGTEPRVFAPAQEIETIWQQQFGVERHSTVETVRNAMGPQLYKDYFSFCFVRNPFPRAYSAWKFLKRRADLGRLPDTLRLSLEMCTFEQFLDQQFASASQPVPLRPQSYWIADRNDVSFIGRTETLDEDLRHILTRIAPKGRWDDLSSPRRNVAAEIDEWRAMSCGAQDLIRELYATDFERFDYPTAFDAAVPGA